MDDPIFENINQAQYAWYALMIMQDKEKEFERTLSLVDYHASFWNSEGVKKVKEYRESQTEEAIKEADDFVKNLNKDDIKNNPIIDALKKIRQDKNNNKEEGIFSSINLNKLIKEGI